MAKRAEDLFDDEEIPGPDPYDVRKIPIAKLYVDPDVQRIHPETGKADFKPPFRWELFETLTVAPSPSRRGFFVVLEGQRRLTYLNEHSYREDVWCRVVDDARSVESQSGIGLGIPMGRKYHSAYQRYVQKGRMGDERIHLIDDMLRRHGLRVADHQSVYAIGSPSFIMSISERKQWGTDEIVNHIERMVVVIEAAFAEETYRWHDALLKMVEGIIRRNDRTLDDSRMIQRLKTRSAETWVQQSKNATRRTGIVDHMAERFCSEYNRKLSDRRKIVW